MMKGAAYPFWSDAFPQPLGRLFPSHHKGVCSKSLQGLFLSMLMSKFDHVQDVLRVQTEEVWSFDRPMLQLTNSSGQLEPARGLAKRTHGQAPSNAGACMGRYRLLSPVVLLAVIVVQSRHKSIRSQYSCEAVVKH